MSEDKPVEQVGAAGADPSPSANDVLAETQGEVTPQANGAPAANGAAAENAVPAANGNGASAENGVPVHLNVLQQMLRSSWLVTVLAIVGAMVISGVLIAAADERVRDASAYFFSRPYDMLWYAGDSIVESYWALFKGAVFNPARDTWGLKIKPITDTMVFATPLLFAALGIGIGFRAGLFNIGAQGQMIMGAAAAAFIGFKATLPGALLLIAALVASLVLGGIWAGISGYLKAKTGANEVIVTIMLNWIAVWLVAYLLTTNFMTEGVSGKQTPPVASNAMLPGLLGKSFNLHFGFILALLAAAGVWWLMERSTLGFKFRAVGANPDAARTAGINVDSAYIWVMTIAGVLAGLGGASIVLGTTKTLTESTVGSFGFDAITVALLGRSRPLGTVFAALLFGALRAGSPLMQTLAGTPPDIVFVVQSVIVLFIAAPALVRTLFILPKTGVATVKEVTA